MLFYIAFRYVGPRMLKHAGDLIK